LQDEKSETQILKTIIQYLYDGKYWDRLNSRIEELLKVRGSIITV
jgi:hypothetical protein